MTREPVDSPSTDSVRVEKSATGVVIEVTVAAPIDTVWRHLREPELIRRWHGWDFDGPDGEIEFIYREHAREGADPYVLETTGGPAPGSFELGDRFDLRGVAGSTVVRITRGPKGTDEVWDSMYDDITEGWTSFLAQLRFVLETHPDTVRRTVFLNAGGGAPVPEARDLLGVTDPPAGSYRLAPTPSLGLSGSVWFRTGHQVGLKVDSYGPGLVVVVDQPGPQPGRARSSMVIVSTFGLSDARFAEVEAAWRSWWDSHHEAGTALG